MATERASGPSEFQATHFLSFTCKIIKIIALDSSTRPQADATRPYYPRNYIPSGNMSGVVVTQPFFDSGLVSPHAALYTKRRASMALHLLISKGAVYIADVWVRNQHLQPP